MQSKKIYISEGYRGLYKGFSVSLIGVIPSQIVYLTSLEYFRSIFPHNHDGIKNFFAGLLASLCSTSISVPIEVVSQRLMLRGSNGYSGGIDGIKKNN